MITALAREKYIRVKEWIDDKSILAPTLAYAVLDGYVDGEVYADSTEPNNVLIGTESGIYFVAGVGDNDLFNTHLVSLFKERKQNGSRFTLFSASQQWDEVLQKELRDEIKLMKRYHFTFNSQREPNTRDLPAGYTLQQINQTTIQQSSEFDEAYYKEYWSSMSNFLENGFGYCIVYDGKVICECTSIFASDKYAEIDIVTDEEHRGKGLAAIAAEAFILHCQESGRTPRWDCFVSNTASIRMAEKMDFENPLEYSIIVKNV
ncbi:GNAT family N-acetyltransferase [Pseudalkalibacillus sp. SCS-8]|uniref:GNAT family N-acetyltransferase n=1 Tax=Pseudalkalibacillus nanhaiensis TaxID=3115291 RepID=UPI0032DAB6EB